MVDFTVGLFTMFLVKVFNMNDENLVSFLELSINIVFVSASAL